MLGLGFFVWFGLFGVEFFATSGFKLLILTIMFQIIVQ